jgi:predicted phage-related endonuclease
MRWGRALEPLIRQRYADETGRRVQVIEDLLRHPQHDWMVAHVDGMADGRVLEVKTARSDVGWGEPGTDQIPEAYLIQVQHYMVVTATPVADVAALIGGQDFRIYEVPANAELQEALIEIEAEFWQRVQNANPPDAVCLADVKARWGRVSTASKIVADAAALEAYRRLTIATANRKAAEADEDAAKTILCGHMGVNDTLVDDTGRVLATWKAAKATHRFDAKQFQLSYPELYQSFLKPGEPSRRFLPKLPKEDS